jgi:hypothetical protein
MHQLDKETKSFLHKALADVDAALKNYAAVEDTKGATGKKGAVSAKEKLLAERAGVGKERRGKERAEAKGKAKADAKGNKKREPSDLEKSLKGDKVREAQLPVHKSNCRDAPRHGSIMTSTPSTRRQLDGVPLGVCAPDSPIDLRTGNCSCVGRRSRTSTLTEMSILLHEI